MTLAFTFKFQFQGSLHKTFKACRTYRSINGKIYGKNSLSYDLRGRGENRNQQRAINPVCPQVSLWLFSAAWFMGSFAGRRDPANSRRLLEQGKFLRLKTLGRASLQSKARRDFRLAVTVSADPDKALDVGGESEWKYENPITVGAA
ncbi:hypothetical protein RRG08_007304 [Elysia crispata]|uniref:Uncharacterized protein n=1 Tax=Elysia crispata TaxID=231223 RepID=A0AAE1AWI5_9GAST|nr:hypothetical protein RRG08_007304 [Elysia crispata]